MQRQRNILWEMTSRIVMLAAAAPLLLSYLAMVVNPTKAWYMSLFGTLFLPFFLLNLFLLLRALLHWSSSALIPLLALLPAFFFMGRYVQLRADGEEPETGCIKVVSYNTGNFILAKKNRLHWPEGAGPEICRDSVFAYLRKTDADIICLQEVTLDSDDDGAAYLERAFPGYQASYFLYVGPEGNYGNVTLSRFPILDKGIMDFDDSSNLAIYTDVQVHGKTVRIYNCHLESYSISLAGLARSLGRDTTVVRSTERKIRKSILLRPQQVGRLTADIEDCPYETLVAGDFNDTPMSYTYARLRRDHRDAFVGAGKGFGATYSVLWPFLRIDYVLYPREYGAVSCRIPRVPYSDHYPVITRLNVR